MTTPSPMDRGETPGHLRLDQDPQLFEAFANLIRERLPFDELFPGDTYMSRLCHPDGIDESIYYTVEIGIGLVDEDIALEVDIGLDEDVDEFIHYVRLTSEKYDEVSPGEVDLVDKKEEVFGMILSRGIATYLAEKDWDEQVFYPASDIATDHLVNLGDDERALFDEMVAGNEVADLVGMDQEAYILDADGEEGAYSPLTLGHTLEVSKLLGSVSVIRRELPPLVKKAS